jgi:multisubunit Na+/H+ antiporter MnhB subunit
MSLRLAYLLLCVLGTVVPYTPFIRWLSAQPANFNLPARFVNELFSTRIGAFFGLDVVISALTLFVFMFAERRLHPKVRVWTAVLGTALVGVSLGLPLYLYERDRVRRLA